MTFPYKAIPSKAAIASEELSCSRPCGLSSTEGNKKMNSKWVGTKYWAWVSTKRLQLKPSSTYSTSVHQPRNFRGTNLSDGTWGSSCLRQKGWQYHEYRGEFDRCIPAPIRGDASRQWQRRRCGIHSGSGDRCTCSKESGRFEIKRKPSIWA